MDVRALGYVAIETPVPEDWAGYLLDVIGAMEEISPPGCDPEARCFRLDERAYRISVKRSATESYVGGWELSSKAALEAAAAELAAAGVAVKEAGGAEAAQRGVSGLVCFDDPFGNPMELFWGQQASEIPFDSPHGMSGFVAGASGLGHLLYVVPSCSEALDFYCGVLGFKQTDYYAFGPDNSAWFLRCNSRHHTLAFMDLDIPGGPGLNHIMLEAKRLEDVGRALDRAMDAGVEIVNSLGQHTNDKTVSFYMRSPGRTNVEMGVDQLRCDEDTWQVVAWSGRGDLWGHRGTFMDDIAKSRV